MATSKENYWKYSLIILLITLGIILFNQFRPFFTGLLGAFTMYVLLRKQMFFLVEKKKINKTVSAILIVSEVILCILIPTFLMIWMLLGRIQYVDLDIAPLIAFVQQYIQLIQEKTGYDILSVNNLTTATSYVTKFIQLLIGQVSNVIVNSVVLIFILYFMLISGREIEAYTYDLLPFNDKNKTHILGEIKRMVLSNAIGIPLLAIIQGIIAFIGYLIFGVPSPLLFGFITCFSTIIPLLGTGLVWFPLCIYFVLTGNWVSAIGLATYSLVILTNVDNVIRFILQKKLADTHPLITVFGVIMGLSLFGFWGVIFGPLLLSMFFLLLKIFKTEYIQ
ncbi:MAG: AI-2E family transporter [Massilibacteroides sp.]|nr:AI-2E family transporter [Massilibacteroides sp.]MDD3062637.1 AI-2E family transporter [Massilibacteroides sp.]MDD4116030.1 AI-2E family transporter [Massilibacteroides sp.]MDD4659534.1 AI-2E family transporter [Massilibacteroides sp.]